MTNSLENLPPEMQQRLAQIMQQAQMGGQAHAGAPVAPQMQAPPPKLAKPPSLMDHVIALRQEVHALSQQVAANSQVVEAVGGAVGRLYETFQPSEQPPQTGTYSQDFQDQRIGNQDVADY